MIECDYEGEKGVGDLSCKYKYPAIYDGVKLIQVGINCKAVSEWVILWNSSSIYTFVEHFHSLWGFHVHVLKTWFSPQYGVV